MNRRGFTLLEIAVVLTLIAVVLSGGLVLTSAYMQSSQFNMTVVRMDAIEKALLNYAAANNRLPCPGSLTLASTTSGYGLEAGTTAGGTGTGECVTGMTPAANFKSASGTEEGAVPVRALRLPDDYMYDAWGERFRYAVDPAWTVSSALPAPQACRLTITPNAAAITVYDAALGARTTNGAYALISHGANKHGGYSTSGAIYKGYSLSTIEWLNCHCDVYSVPTAYDGAYLQKLPSHNAANILDNFDDIVTFKEAWQLQAPNYPLASAGTCEVVYVADVVNDRVQKFDTNGNYLGQIGCATGACSAGSGDGQLAGPARLAFDSNGNLWVVEWDNYRVQKFSSSGSYLSKFPTWAEMYQAWGLTVDNSGNVWVTGAVENIIVKYDGSGVFQSQFGTGGTGDGEIILPGGIKVDGSGNLWVTDWDNSRVDEFTSGGAYVAKIGVGDLDQPSDLAFDASGNIWVTNTNWHRLDKFNSSGVHQGGFGGYGNADGQMNMPFGIAIDGSGNIWVADTGNNRVEKFDSNGNFLLGIGAGYKGVGGSVGDTGIGNGQFNWPYSVAIGSR